MKLIDKNFITVFTIMTFMPILIYKGNIRYEQLFIYLLIVLFIPCIFFEFFKFRNLIKIFPFLIFFFIAILQSTNFFYNNIFYNNYTYFNILANLEDIIHPIAIITLLNFFYKNYDLVEIKYIQKKFYQLLIIAMVVNAIIAIISLLNVEFYKYIHKLYISLDDIKSLSTTSARAYTMNKVFGIFDTPSGAGMLYFLSILAVINIQRNANIVSIICFFLLLIGGLLSFSKTFYIALPFLFIYFFTKARFGEKILIFIILLVIIFLNIGPIQIFIDRVIVDPHRIIDFLTGGRYFASESPISQNFQDIITYSPIFGFGSGIFAASERPADSLFSYIGFVGGFVSLILFLIYIFLIGLKIFKNSRANFQFEMIHVIYIYFLICSFGATLFFTNRLAGIIIIFFFLEYKRWHLSKYEKKNFNI